MATLVDITAPEIENGSRIQLWNVTVGVELYNDQPTISEGNTFSTTVDLESANVSAGDTIRMRVTCQAGATALLPLEVVGVINSAGLTFPQSQQSDTVYDDIGIDGSIFAGPNGDSTTGLTMTPDGTNILINLSDTISPYQVSVQQLYSYFAYLQTTSTGITTFYNAITPVDGLNFRVNIDHADLKIQNTGANDVNLMGGRLFRSNETTVVYTDSNQNYGTITHDTGFLLQFIQPQVEAALGNTMASATDMATVKTDVAAIKSDPNLNLITAIYTS